MTNPESTLYAATTTRSLYGAWSHVASGTWRSGVDGITVARFAETLQDGITALQHDLRSGSYAPSPVTGWNQEVGGQSRSFGLPTVRDRIAQRAFLRALAPVFAARTAALSFAYRRGVSWVDALRAVDVARGDGLTVVFRCDIAAFFASIDHEEVHRVLQRDIGETQFVTTMMQWVTAPVVSSKGLQSRRRGLLLGAPLSPALSNMYLADVDAAFVDHDVRLVRYADDMVLLARSHSEVVELSEHLRSMLRVRRLRLHARKSYVSDFDHGFAFLGWVFLGDGGWPSERTPGWTHPLAERSGER